MKKLDGILTGIAGLVNLGSIIGLAAIALKRNNDAYDNAMKYIDAELELIEKDCEIHELECEIIQLKKKYGVKEES